MVVVVTDVLIDRVWGLVLDIGATFVEQWLDIGIRKCQGSPVDLDKKHIVSPRATCTDVRRIGFSFAAHHRECIGRGDSKSQTSCMGTSSVKLAQRPSRRPRTPLGWKYGKRGD